MEEKALTVNSETVASNPGKLRVQYSVFLRCYSLFTLWCIAALLVLLCFTLLHWLFWIPVLLLIAVMVFSAIRTREHFRHGCVNPSKVVSHKPELIAVLTDLTTGQGKWPVVKILEHPLSRMTGGRPPVGTRLATVALYQGTGAEGHWDDFFPVAANCATKDRAAIDRTLRSIDPMDWVELEEGLRQVANAKEIGLYRVDLSALDRQEWAISSGLNRLNPADSCSLLCPTDDRAAVVEVLRSLYERVEVQGPENAWTEITVRGKSRDLHLRAISGPEMAPGLASIAGYFGNVACPMAERKSWVVQRVQSTQLVIFCAAAPRFDRQEAHFYAMGQIAQRLGGLIFTGSSVVDGYGRIVLNGNGYFDPY